MSISQFHNSRVACKILTSASKKIEKHAQENNMSCKLGRKLYFNHVSGHLYSHQKIHILNATFTNVYSKNVIDENKLISFLI